ncbi:hypothetical protein BC828DRAFT_416284 [Blastocladiella britannica]|nr:hypothetical protein BC828DRAFT_416284 [Blastocladiella britannica]
MYDRPSLRLIVASLPPSLKRLSLNKSRVGTAKQSGDGNNNPPPAKIIHVRRNMLQAPTLDAQGRPMTSTTLFMTADLPDADPLAYWVLPRSLNHLSLQGAFLCDADMPAIAKSLPAGLTALVLRDNVLCKEGYEALEPALPPSPKILDICNTGIDDDGAMTLAKYLPATLLEFDLGMGTLGDTGAGAKALAAKLPSSLQVLFIDQNQFGDDGLRAFARALPSGLKLVHAYSVGASESAIAEFRGAAGMAEEIKA